MKSTANQLVVVRLAGLLAACWVVPPLLFHYWGAVVGALAAAGAMGLWYSQYQLPIWKDGRAASFWFVASGYGVIILTLLVSLGRLAGVH
jgi:hypothetical protein